MAEQIRTPTRLRQPPSAVDLSGAAQTHFELLLHRIAKGFLLLIGGWLLVLGAFNLLHPSDWAMGDWLINYSGGFVRRGLTGEFALLLHSLHAPLLWTVLALQWTLYTVLLLAAWGLAQTVRWHWWSAAFFFSPATLAFVLLDPPFAFRKDILFFALLVWCLGLAGKPTTGTTRSRLSQALLLTPGCAVCLLAHEGLIVFFPYLFAALYLVSGSLRRAFEIFALPAAVSVVLFAVISRFPGDLQVAQSVCSSIGGTLTVPPSGICGGAIDYLAHDATYAHNEVVRVMLAGHLAAHLPWLFVLPLLPAALGFAHLWRSNAQDARVLLATAALAWLFSTSVFFYGTDWTRWVYLHITSLMFLMLFAAQRGRHHELQTTSVLFGARGAKRWSAWALLLVYCLGWELTVYGQRPLYGSFIRFVTHNMARGQQ